MSDEASPIPPSQPHSQTSQQAAGGIRGRTNVLRQQVLAYLDHQGALGATDEEIQEALGLNPSTQRPRRVELVREGKVGDSGERRPTRSGRSAVVWVSLSTK